MTGTCFLNTIVNGFLLSENPRKMLLENLDMILINDPGYRAILEKPLEEWACPLRYQARQSLDFMNMILYRTYKRTKIKSTFDILKLTSRKFVSVNASPTDVLYGEGGHPVYTIIDFLKNVNFPGFVGNTSNGTYKYLITPPESARNHLILFQYLDSLNSIPADPHEFAKFHYYIDVNQSNFAFPHLDMMGTVYDLEFATIFIGAPAPATTLGEFRHVMLGFVCNGVQMIYDSDFNKIIKANWQNLTDPTTVRSIQRLYPAITQLKIMAAFYMNSNIY
jgi:hypothetical protein